MKTPTPNASPSSAPLATAKPEKMTMHVIKRGDTLAGIAAARRSQNLSTEQMLLALQRANAQAFAGNNINRLRAGSVLQIPDDETVRAVDPGKAREFVRAQNAEFQRYREQVARQSARSRSSDATSNLSDPTAQHGVRSTSGEVTQPSQDIPPPVINQDKLKLTAPVGEKNNGTAGATKKSGSNVRSGPDALDQIASDKALADANSRIAALEKNISDLQKLADLRDKPADKPADKAPPDNPSSRTNLPDTAVKLPESPSPAIEPPLTTHPTPPPSAESVKPSVTSPPAEPQDNRLLQEFLQDPPLMLAGGAGLGLLMLFWFVLRYRRRAQATIPKTVESEGVQSIFEQAGGRNIDTSNSVFHSNFVPSVSQLDTNEVDAVAEADVYIAYGRDEQAEEILQDALRVHPERHALRVKLLEIYATRKDRQKFGTLAAELRVLTHGVGEAWTQAARMGVVLDPGNLLYGAALREEQARPSEQTSLSSPPASAMVAQPAAETSPVADFEFRLEGLLDEQKNDMNAQAKSAIKSATKSGFSTGSNSAGTTHSVPASDSSRLLDFHFSDAATSVPTSPPSTTAGLKTGMVSDKPVDVAALQTKLDLAIACDEIGDKEGARELLSEVAAGADTGLAQRAQSLLSQLA